MAEQNFQKINVNAVFANFKTAQFQRRITPLEFYTSDGHTHPIGAIRRTYIDHINGGHIHFILRTKAGRYFDIVYYPPKMAWYLVVEITDSFDIS